MRVMIKRIDNENKEVTLHYFGEFDLEGFMKNEHKGKMFGYLEPVVKGSTTDEQRKHFYALVKDISDYTGDPEWQIKLRMKYLYMLTHDKVKEPSLARNTMKKGDTRLLIQTTIDYALENDIALNGNYLPYFEEKQLFKLLMKRMCFICGKPADVHHQENLVGMGRDRKTVNHADSKFFALCRQHHQQAHQMGLKSFQEHYHIMPISLSEENLKELNIM